MKRKFTSTGVLFMVLVVALASLAVAYTQWNWMLTIDGTVNTGDVGGMFGEAFTDDDGVIDNPDKDSLDAGPDPAASGFDPKARYTLDVGDCAAAVDTVNPNQATVTLNNVYPSYYCTAWFHIVNTGTVPLKISEVRVNGTPVIPSTTNPFDLDGDTLPDINIHVSEITLDQVVPVGEPVQMDLDMHIKPDASPDSILNFDVAIDLVVFNQ